MTSKNQEMQLANNRISDSVLTISSNLIFSCVITYPMSQFVFYCQENHAFEGHLLNIYLVFSSEIDKSILTTFTKVRLNTVKVT